MLVDLEQRLASWQGKSSIRLTDDFRRIGGFMLKNLSVLHWYAVHLERHEQLITQLDVALKRHPEFERAFADFESQKVCYLPLGAYLLKPVQRLVHYQTLLERLVKLYGSEHPDLVDCRACLGKIHEVLDPVEDRISHLENWQKLMELQQGLLGIDCLVHANRQFIREGCLQKLSRKGYQQRMFFLFSDMLLYTNRMATSTLQFKVHGQLSLKGMCVDDADTTMASSGMNSFSVYTNNRCLVIAASTADERDKWVADLRVAITAAGAQALDGATNPRILYPSLKSNSSSEALDDPLDDSRHSAISASPEPGAGGPTLSAALQHRANMTMHVCWHRSLSVGVTEHSIAFRNQLSGYLLRKFKNSNGWQKLWVVFTNFCLFFYKNFQDDYPLASLPLLGYTVGMPTTSDGIHKDNVFKLQFKNHVYFFRAEGEVTFRRWMEVLGSVTSQSTGTAPSAGGTLGHQSSIAGTPPPPTPPPRFVT
jgi:FERM/RhoGEF/pleckstrin domain protein 2